nr:16S rRNA processing protein RimM [Desulfobacula sp.]
MMNKTASFTLGKVTGVHGLGGMLKVASFAESADTFEKGRHIVIKGGEEERSYLILHASPHKQGLLLGLEGIGSREQAEALVGKDILMDRGQLPEPEEGAWYWQDLMGLDVVDHIKGYLGKITHLFRTGANDVLVITDKDRETLVPMHRYFVESVDMDAQTVKNHPA